MKELDWQYSRNRRRHWVTDGEFYKDRNLWEIVEVRANYGCHKPDEGYDLYYKGNKIAHGKTVKALKKQAEEW